MAWVSAFGFGAAAGPNGPAPEGRRHAPCERATKWARLAPAPDGSARAGLDVLSGAFLHSCPLNIALRCGAPQRLLP